MQQPTPPLQLLPAFEATARLLSFKQAAEVLNVTPSAVSQQVKTLENILGVTLFERTTRSISLTQAGQRYYQLASETLQHFYSGHQRWAQSMAKPTVRLSTMAQVAFDVLIPALPTFQEQYPNIDLRIETSEQLVDFDTDWVDLAIRVGDGQWPRLNSEKLCSLTASLVTSPDLEASIDFKTADDFKQLTLIHARSHTNDWENVAKTFKLELSDNHQLYFENYHSALAAAENSLGVTIATFPVTQRRIDRGDLVRLIPQKYPIQPACYLAYRGEIQENSALDSVRKWLTQLFADLSNPSSSSK